MAGLYLLDTNGASDFFSGRSAAMKRNLDEAQRTLATIAISAITEAELLYGFEHRPEATRLRRAYGHFRALATVLPWDSAVSTSYAKLRQSLTARGLVVERMDLLIASHAHALGATLVSRDKAFRYVSDAVHVVNWATDLAVIG